LKKLLVTVVLAVVLVLRTAATGSAAQSPGNWSAVGGVPEPTAGCLLTVDGAVYAGAGDGNVWSWDGAQWINVGGLAGSTGIGSVQSLATVNGAVYAGTLDGVWAWDGAAWSQVGSLADEAAQVFALTTVNGAVYAGTEDGVWVRDSAAWFRAGNFPGGAAWSLATVNNAVYAGSRQGVWGWDGSAWSQVGNLPGDAAWVYSLAAVGNTLYAGTLDGVWAWDGAAWSQVGGLTDDAAVVHSLALVDGALYAGTGNGVWAWDGSAWSRVGAGVFPGDAVQAFSLAAIGGKIYAGTQIGVWVWDGTVWNRVSSGGLPGYAAWIRSLATDNGALYTGTWGGGIWVWDGAAWTQVGGLTANTAIAPALITFNGKLYAGTFRGVLAWNRSFWSQVGSPVEGMDDTTQISCLAAVNGTLYAGTLNGGVWAWDGSAWSQAGSLTGSAAWINRLIAFDGTLYAGTLDGVWVWDGFAWSRAGNLPGDAAWVYSLAAAGNTLYAGTLDGVWAWDGSAWSQAGSLPGDAAVARSLAAVNGTLYAGTEDGVWVWDGFAWSRAGNLPGDAALVFSLAAAGNRLYAGTWAGVWSFTLPVSPGGGSGGPDAPGPVHSIAGSAVVYPSAGGTVGLGSDASITIPPGALQGSAGVNVAIRRVASPPPAPVGYTITGAYEFTVNGLDHYTFNKPVTLTFAFDPAIVAEGTTPAVYYYNGKEWVLLTGAVDWTGNTITVTVDHFTKYAVMAKVPAPAPALQDIAGHWAQAVIEKLVSLGAVSGYPDGAFRPDQNITRAEFVSVLVKAFQLKPAKGKVFADTSGHWAGEAISTAANYGIVAGYGDGRFGPDEPVTREQMAAMTVKAAKLNPVSGELAFTDSSDISPWANDSVVTAVKNGIISGYPDNTLRPGARATRAEAAAMAVRAIGAEGARHQ